MKSIRRKPRNEDEINGFYKLMESKIKRNIDSEKVKWIGNREIERKITSTESFVDKEIQFMGILTQECEKLGTKPIVVGGSAVDFYTEGICPSYDIDLIGDRKIIGKILEKTFDFEPCGRIWINEEMEFSVEVPNNHLAGDRDKITVIRSENLKVYVIGLEDLIIDRLNACVHWKSQTDCDQAWFMIKYYRNKLDFEYLEKKAIVEKIFNVLKKFLIQ